MTSPETQELQPDDVPGPESAISKKILKKNEGGDILQRDLAPVPGNSADKVDGVPRGSNAERLVSEEHKAPNAAAPKDENGAISARVNYKSHHRDFEGSSEHSSEHGAGNSSNRKLPPTFDPATCRTL
jgi:hypothetical protein